MLYIFNFYANKYSVYVFLIMKNIKIPVILGPTGSGKSNLSMSLAREFGLSIISCDSRQIYKYMDIGTAKPSLIDLKEVVHYMIDIIEPNQSFSAFSFQEMVLEIIRKGSEKGERFLICGGTGLYYEALSSGVGPQIATDQELINIYTEKAKIHGRKRIHDELKLLDPIAASKLHPNDLQRVIRALAVFKKEGISIYELQNKKRPPENIEFLNLILLPQRKTLYERINNRVNEMAQAGLFNEFKQLIEKGYSQDDPGMRTVGYQEFFSRKNDTDEEIKLVLDSIKQNSRKYAKRQFTWFNNRVNGERLDPDKLSDSIDILNKIKFFLDIKR